MNTATDLYEHANYSHLTEAGWDSSQAIGLPARFADKAQLVSNEDQALYIKLMEANQILNRYERDKSWPVVRQFKDLLNGNGGLDQFGTPQTRAMGAMLQESAGYILRESSNYIHGRSDFAKLIQACITYVMGPTWDNCNSCWDQYTYVAPPRTTCETTGSYSMVSVKSAPTAPEALGEGTWITNHQFGVNTEQGFCVKLFGCGVAWTSMMQWCLRPDAARMMLTMLTKRLRNAQTKRILKLWAGTSAFNTSEFPEKNGTTPAHESYLLNNPAFSADEMSKAIERLNTMQDDEGDPICEDRNPILVTGSWKIKCAAELMLKTIQTRTKTKKSDGTEVEVIVGESELCGSFTICYDPWLRTIQTGVIPTGSANGAGERYYNHAWAVTVPARAGSYNAMEVAYLSGWERPVVLKKAGNIQTLGGALRGDLGEWGSMNHYYGAFVGDGGRVQQKKLWMLSKGDGSATV